MQLGINLKAILNFQVIRQDDPLGNAVRTHLKETVLERGGPEGGRLSRWDKMKTIRLEV